jgi:uncharacterized protein YjbI with pentapeptide repeats
LTIIKNKDEFLIWISQKDEEYISKGYEYCNYRISDKMLNLDNLKIENIDITYKSFGSTFFKNCLFINCDINHSVFHSCTFIDCKFIQCKFYQTKFLFIELTNSQFIDCTIVGLEFADIDAKDSSFIDCPEVLDLSLRGFGNRFISFVRCYLHHLDVEPISINDRYTKDINEEKLDFLECIIKESSFDRIDFTQSSFIECDLSLIQFSSCEFSAGTIDISNKTLANEFNMIDIRTILNSPPLNKTILENIFGINSSDIKEYLIDLTSKIEFQSIFISYSFADKQFAKRINETLIRRGIMSFLWEYDSPGGKSLKNIMLSNIKNKDRVLFIASENSIKSRACQFELSKGREKQEITWKDVLFPIHIDNFLFNLEKDQIRPIEEQEEYWKNIQELRKLNSLDFSNFIDPKAIDEHKFEKLIYRLIKGLRK